MPPARGPLSQWLSGVLTAEPGRLPAAVSSPAVAAGAGPAWADDDLQLALWCCYELHYRGFGGVSDDWEWHPVIVGFRGQLERCWITDLRELASPRAPAAADIPSALTELAGRRDGADQLLACWTAGRTSLRAAGMLVAGAR
jgi:hypothetical protein